MKKYFQLTSAEAIQHFLYHDNSLVPEFTNEIEQKLEDLDKLETNVSVTIVIPTHRTSPDNKVDPILLKNLANKAEEDLCTKLDKRLFACIKENIEEARNAINHTYNLDSLVLYANEHFSSVVKLPIHLEEKITVSPFFDLSPLYKMCQQNEHYYIVTISKNVIRLIEAYNDRLIQEVHNKDFPFHNDKYYTTNAAKLAQDMYTDNLEKEFFNVADKRLQKYQTENSLPVILAGDVKSTAYFQEMMDNKDCVIAHAEGNYDPFKAPDIIRCVYPIMEEFKKNQQQACLQNISNAISSGQLTTNVREIFQKLYEGMGEVLYLGQNYSLKGYPDIEDFKIHLRRKGLDNPVHDEELVLLFMKLANMYNTNVVFLDDDLMKPYKGIALIDRF